MHAHFASFWPNSSWFQNRKFLNEHDSLLGPLTDPEISPKLNFTKLLNFSIKTFSFEPIWILKERYFQIARKYWPPKTWLQESFPEKLASSTAICSWVFYSQISSCNELSWNRKTTRSTPFGRLSIHAYFTSK